MSVKCFFPNQDIGPLKALILKILNFIINYFVGQDALKGPNGGELWHRE
jgi:hypothetical protein